MSATSMPSNSVPQVQSAHRNRSARVATAVVGLFFAAAELARIGRWSLWADEAFSVSTSDRSWESLAKLTYRSEATGSLYAAALRLWLQLGRSEAWLRGFSTVCVVACVPLLFGIGRRLFSDRAGSVAVVLFCVNGSVLRYGQHIRFYAFVVLISLAMTYCVVRDVRDVREGCEGCEGCEDSGDRLRNLWWRVGWSVSAVVLVATHVLAAPLVISLVLVRLVFVPKVARQSVSTLLGVLPSGVVAVAVTLLVRKRDEGQSLVTFHPLGSVSDVVQTIAGNGGRFAASLVLGGLFLLIGSDPGWLVDRTRRFEIAFLVAGLVGPSSMLYVASFIQPSFLGRYVLYSIPFGCLLIGGFLDSHWSQARARVASVALVVALLSISAGSLLGVQRWWRGVEVADWRSLANEVFLHSSRNDAIVFANDSTRLFFEYYRPKHLRAPMPLFPVDPWGGFETGDQRYEPFPIAAIETALDTTPRLWVVLEAGLDTTPFPAVAKLSGVPVLRELRTSAGVVRLYNLQGAPATAKVT